MFPGIVAASMVAEKKKIKKKMEEDLIQQAFDAIDKETIQEESRKLAKEVPKKPVNLGPASSAVEASQIMEESKKEEQIFECTICSGQFNRRFNQRQAYGSGS